MTVEISRAEMAKIAAACDDIEEGIEDTGKRIGALPDAGLDGWASQRAIAAVNKRWQQKTRHSGGQWQYMASSVRATAADIDGTDERNAFNFPAVGKGEKDIPLPWHLERHDTQPLGTI